MGYFNRVLDSCSFYPYDLDVSSLANTCMCDFTKHYSMYSPLALGSVQTHHPLSRKPAYTLLPFCRLLIQMFWAKDQI